jgi:aminobenzoyl-glutamate utilization protein B
MTDYSKLDEIVDKNADVIIDMADTVWNEPELGFHEVKSSAYEGIVLADHGFAMSDRGIGGLDTSWIATWGSGSPVIGILVEFDALPSLGQAAASTKTPREDGNTNGHGCGHNLIGSGAIGAAISLKEYMEAEGIQGTLKVFGCPAEELLIGKNYMAKAGAFEGLDVAIHHHPGPRNVAFNFQMQAAADLAIEWHGKSAHAAVAPWAGRSALHASEVFTTAANGMREQMLPSCRLHYYMMEGPRAVNTIPDYVKLMVRFRAADTETVAEYMAWIKDMAKGAALATQTQEKVTVVSTLYDLLPNNVLADHLTETMGRYFPVDWTEEEQSFAKAIQKEMGLEELGMATEVSPNPGGALMGGSTEVGDVSWSVPTIGAVFAAAPQGVALHTWGVTACVGMSIGHKAVVQSAKSLAAMGLDLLTQPELIEAAKKEFNERTGGKPYKSLNELDGPPGGRLDEVALEDYECCIHAAMEHLGVKEIPRAQASD